MTVSQTYNLLYNSTDPSPSYSQNVYSILMILGALSIAFLAFEAIIKGNEFKFMGFISLSVIVMYILLPSHRSSRSTIQFIRIIFLGANEPKEFAVFMPLYVLILFFQFVVAIPVFRSFKWKIFKIVGTSPQLKSFNFIFYIFKNPLEFIKFTQPS
jgi:hypothetical protein